MSNFLFQNISFVFAAPKVVSDILEQMEEVKESSSRSNTSMEDVLDGTEDIQIDDDGNVEISEEGIIGTATELFGNKIYETTSIDTVQEVINTPIEDESCLEDLTQKAESLTENISTIVEETVLNPMIEEAQKSLGQELRKSERRQLENGLKAKADNLIRNAVDDFKQTTKELDVQKEEELSKCKTEEDRLEVHQEMDNLKKEAAKKMQQEINSRLTSFVEDAGKETVRQVETSKQEEKKRTIEDEVRGRLRGFTRTIPSFLMAYGDDTVVLETFDTVIPDNVFKDVTGITLDQFRFLRDGGDYQDEETGEIKHFDGNVFDRLVFTVNCTY